MRYRNNKNPTGEPSTSGKPAKPKPCPECGGVGGHQNVRESVQTNAKTTGSAKYKIVSKRCPRA
jgi:hypothetical protein